MKTAFTKETIKSSIKIFLRFQHDGEARWAGHQYWDLFWTFRSVPEKLILKIFEKKENLCGRVIVIKVLGERPLI